MTVRALAVILGLAGLAAAPGPDADLAAYRKAEAAGAVGTVSGRAYTERPLGGTVVVLLPRSAALVGRLEEIKTHARDSERAFGSAATALRQAREAYEQRLWELGVPDFVRTTVVDGGGAFSMAGLPAGSWLLIATRSVFEARSSPKTRSRGREVFVPRQRLVGYYAVSIWLRELTLAGGGLETLDLSDRNVWFTGIVEDRVLDAGP